MANDTVAERQQTAIHQLSEKIALEQEFIQELNVIFDEIASEAADLFSRTGNLPNIQDYVEDFQRILFQHYMKVEEAFRDNLRVDEGLAVKLRKLTTQKQINESIDADMESYSATRAPDIAEILVNTTINQLDAEYGKAGVALQADLDKEVASLESNLNSIEGDIEELNDSVGALLALLAVPGAITSEEQRRDIQQQINRLEQERDSQYAELGRLDDELDTVLEAGISNSDIAILATTGFVAREALRAETIAATETQNIAETTKYVEAQNVGEAATNESKVVKIWVTFGDEFVRPYHVTTEGQTKPKDEPFEVGPFDLMRYPGDKSLGADINNIIKCRCSAIYKIEGTLEGPEFEEGPPNATPAGPFEIEPF